MRIVLDLTKPLSRGDSCIFVRRQSGLIFKYEKIPRFRFKCGIIRHGGRGCIALGERKMIGKRGGAQFEPWL